MCGFQKHQWTFDLVVFLIDFVAVAIDIALLSTVPPVAFYMTCHYLYNKGSIPTTKVTTATAVLSRRRRQRRFLSSGAAEEAELENIITITSLCNKRAWANCSIFQPGDQLLLTFGKIRSTGTCSPNSYVRVNFM